MAITAAGLAPRFFPHQVVAALTGSMSISIQLNFEIFDILYI
jgi:hypothetical protein